MEVASCHEALGQCDGRRHVSRDTRTVRDFLCPSVIGRDREIAELTGALHGAADSRGSACFLVGEAGIGKSRLVRELVDTARGLRLPVLLGRATQSTGTVAFRPVSEALFSYFRGAALPDVAELEPFRGSLARLVPQWRQDDVPGAADSVVMLAEAILRLLRAVAGQTGCLLGLEDLHWADPETLAIVEYLSENLASEPVLLLCSVRSEPGPALDLVQLARRPPDGLGREPRPVGSRRHRCHGARLPVGPGSARPGAHAARGERRRLAVLRRGAARRRGRRGCSRAARRWLGGARAGRATGPPHLRRERRPPPRLTGRRRTDPGHRRGARQAVRLGGVVRSDRPAAGRRTGCAARRRRRPAAGCRSGRARVDGVPARAHARRDRGAFARGRAGRGCTTCVGGDPVGSPGCPG